MVKISAQYPSLIRRLLNVWYRHFRVYTKNLISNGLPPFMEPLIFLAGIGLGLGKHIVSMENIPYIQFLSTGLLVTSSMNTASYECTFGTFFRLEFDHVYDGMLGTPITSSDLLVGEMFWVGTKGLFFSLCGLIIILTFGILPLNMILLTPIIGFITGMMFGALSLWITSFVKNMNHFNFYFTGVISPMFFFSGIVFPITDLPKFIHPFAEFLPLTHAVRLVRALSFQQFDTGNIVSLAYCFAFIALFGWLAVRRLSKRLID